MPMEKRWPTLVALVRREQRGLERAAVESLRACGCPRCVMQLMMMGQPIPEEALLQSQERASLGASGFVTTGHHLDVKLN